MSIIIKVTMFSSILALILLLLYFWYITSFLIPNNVSQPDQSLMNPPPKATSHYIRAQGNKFKFISNSQTVWEDALPESYHVSNNQFTVRDACYQQPNGTLVPATNFALYNHVKDDKLISSNVTFEPDANFMLHDKNPFYFSCEKGKIHQLHMCPSGQYFLDTACHIIDQCAGQKDGKKLADPYDTQRFYECYREKAVSKPCPPNTYFAYDKCYDPMLVGLYCFSVTKPKILDYKTLVVCHNGKITYEVCPPGLRYFDAPKCEPEACVGKSNGGRIPLPKQVIGPLSFSPGYMECFNEKVTRTHMCPQEWDFYLSKGENLTHLPQVFDGKECSIPELCVNVRPNRSDVVVPVHEFTKHVRNWDSSEYFDRVKGYTCDGSKRKLVSVDPGKIIYSKRLKVESACDPNTERVIVSNSHKDYFDCKTNSVQTCPANEFFDGYNCQKTIPHAFEFNRLQMFQLDSLREDNGMVPWDYSKLPSVKPCKPPDSEYLQTYNVCSHPDCVLYPWLSQIPFQVALPNGSLCTFDDQTRYIQKEETEDKYLYWAQRRVDRVDPTEKCVPGQNIQSGHFVYDKTIFATCDPKQPFVFCPSSNTNGITLINGKQSHGTPSFWACEPSSMEGIIPPRTKISFMKNEVKLLRPASGNQTDVMINNQQTAILQTGHVMKDRFILETLNEPIKVEYEYRVTHPPEVAWPDQVSSFPGAFLIKLLDFTRKEVQIQRYGIKDSLTGFKLGE